MRIRYCVLYPQAENVHLIKDVGMIAYKLHKLFDYEASVACYKNDNYDYLNKEVKGLNMSFIEKRYKSDILDGIRFLRKKSKNIDILQLFHITLRTVFYAFTYKFFNPKGKIFLKLDCTEKLIIVIKSLNGIKLKMLNAFLNKVDIIGVEQERLYRELEKILTEQKEKLLLIPNGIDFQGSNKFDNFNFNEKENIILHVSRLGSPEKATEVLLDAISKVSCLEGGQWKISMVGPIEDSFKEYIDEFFKKHESLKNIIKFKGAIYDRELLYEEYKKAKIFCLSSNYESFGIALLEAAAFGDVIISTDVGIAKELIDCGNGAVVNTNDSEALAAKLEELISNAGLEELSKVTEKLCRERFDWNNIVALLHDRLVRISRG